MVPIFQQRKSLAELEEETEELEALNKKAGMELSLAEKRRATFELKKRGLEPKHFGFNWQAIWQWLKTH